VRLRRTIVFAEETCITQRPFVTRTWAPRGHTPVFKHRFGWKRLSATVALTTDGRMLFSLKEGACTGDDSAAFVKKLLRAVEGRILLVWDNVAIHKGPAMRALLARPQVRARLEILPLPPYAPELNPEELLNAQLKCRRLANRSPDALAALERSARGSLLAKSRDRKGIEALLTPKRHGLLTAKDLVKLSCRCH
jgi:transposase